MMRMTMRVLDSVPLKNREDFKNDRQYEKYINKNWKKIIIHNMFVLSSQVDSLFKFLREVETRRDAEKQVGQFGKMIRGV